MVDRLTPQRRSWNMSRIQSKNTSLEKKVRSLLYSLGYRFALHRSDLPGKPDMVLPKYRSVIFVNGCFWHRHKGCKDATTPKSNIAFWKKKFASNVQRDKQNQRDLLKSGWKVIIVWECELGKLKQLSLRLKKLIRAKTSTS